MMLAAAGTPGDAGDFEVIQGFARQTGWLHPFMRDFADYGIALFAVLLLVGWWLARSRHDYRAVAATAWAAAGAGIALAINQLIGHTVREPRPYAALPHVLVLVGRAHDYAFTSDHAVAAGAVATGLLYVDRRLGVGTWCAAILLAFSRVYVGAHYPHDVAAGLGLGVAVIVVGRTFAQPLLSWVARVLLRTPARPLLTARQPARGRVSAT